MNFRGLYSVKYEHKLLDLCNETKRPRQLKHTHKSIVACKSTCLEA